MAKNPFFCDDCATRNTPDSKYCKECGAQLRVVYQTPALSDYDRIDDPTEQERLTQFLDMAFWHNEAGNTDAAIRACQAALAINSNSTTAHSLMGCLYEKQGDDEKAIEHFENVLALNPGSDADRAKLEQLQAGFHAKPVRPSPVYRWLPPVLGTARFSEWAQVWRARMAQVRRPEMPLLPGRATPAIAAGGAAVLVLAGALFLIHPPAPSGAAEAAVAPRAIAGSAFASAAPTQAVPAPVPALPQPIVMEPPRGGFATATPPQTIAQVPNNPFARTPSGTLDMEPMTGSNNYPHGGRTSHASSLRLKALPPIHGVSVTPADDGPLPPAPVSVPADVQAGAQPNAPIAPDANIARHTVVVHQLGGLSEFGGDGGARPASAESQYPAAEPPSHIQITLDPAPSNSHAASSDSGSSAQSGEALQQSAFALQQQGNYRQAASLYQKAVTAFQAQLSAGEDQDAAQRGLQACQTGLEICRQSE